MVVGAYRDVIAWDPRTDTTETLGSHSASIRSVEALGDGYFATADYGGPFCSAIARDNVLACQFHPEKSQHAGARLIGHFLGDISWS